MQMIKVLYILQTADQRQVTTSFPTRLEAGDLNFNQKGEGEHLKKCLREIYMIEI